MNSDQAPHRSADHLPAKFARRFLESHGAIVESTESGFHAVLPEKLSALLEIPDLVHIQNKPSPAPESPRLPIPPSETTSLGIHYGSALLDRMVQLACRDIPLVRYDIHFDYIKSQGFDRLIGEQFIFFNAVGKLESQALVRTRYVIATCRYLAESDEQKEGLMSLAFNLETGAWVQGMADWISGLDRTLQTAGPGNDPDALQLKRVLKQVERTLRNQIAAETAEFRESMQRRFRRDAGNLREYYASLKKEMQTSLERPNLSPQLIAERKEKIDLIPAEQRRKQDDLLKKYSIKISIRPATLMELRTEAIKVLFRVSIGKASKTLPMIYNPVTKGMDPLACRGCGAPTYRCVFCNHHHLLCPTCAARCPVCSNNKRV